MSQIFVSYASEDRRRVAKLVAALEARGWSVFWDREIPPGEEWLAYIEDTIEAASCIVVVWSETSVAKTNKWVRIEAGEARDRNVLVPARIDPVKAPFGFRQFQAADLVGWDGDPTAPEFHRLLTTIEKLVSSGGTAPEIWGKPGEKGWPAGIYEERDENGNELSPPHRIQLMSESEPLPPTSKPGHWWTRARA